MDIIKVYEDWKDGFDEGADRIPPFPSFTPTYEGIKEFIDWVYLLQEEGCLEYHHFLDEDILGYFNEGLEVYDYTFKTIEFDQKEHSWNGKKPVGGEIRLVLGLFRKGESKPISHWLVLGGIEVLVDVTDVEVVDDHFLDISLELWNIEEYKM